MKIKHKEIKILISGDIYSFYIRKIKKHWWSPWRIVMDGQVPARFQLIDGEFQRIYEIENFIEYMKGE